MFYLLGGYSLKAFRDPVHNIIYFDKVKDKLLLELIDTEEFQRLRHIQQLGVSSFTYPGATHTRFAHSLGVAYLMNRFIDKIVSLKNTEIKDDLIKLEENRLLALAAALLHDIGHGPFSHAIEDVTGIDHEDVSVAIITGDTAINRILENYKEGFSKEVSKVILRTHPLTVIVRLLSSQLDVDRIDYLLRDSQMTGAGYGEFDLEWLINVLRIEKYQGELEIGLDLEKGLSIAEDFVMARFYMYKHVYFHKATRSVEVMIKKILERVQQLLTEKKISVSEDLKLVMSKPKTPLSPKVVQSFLRLTDHTLWHYISEWQLHSDNELKHLCTSLLKRELYKSMEDPKNPMKVFEIATDIGKEEGKDYSEVLIRDDPATSFYKDDYLLQRTSRDEESEDREAWEQIILFDKVGKGYELSTISDIIEAVRNKSLELFRYYFEERHRERLTRR